MNKAIIAEPTPQEIKETKLYQQWGSLMKNTK